MIFRTSERLSALVSCSYRSPRHFLSHARPHLAAVRGPGMSLSRSAAPRDLDFELLGHAFYLMTKWRPETGFPLSPGLEVLVRLTRLSARLEPVRLVVGLCADQQHHCSPNAAHWGRSTHDWQSEAVFSTHPHSRVCGRKAPIYGRATKSLATSETFEKFAELKGATADDIRKDLKIGFEWRSGAVAVPQETAALQVLRMVKALGTLQVSANHQRVLARAAVGRDTPCLLFSAR